MALGVGRASLTVSLLSVISIVLGVVNQAVVAKYFGASPELDEFLIASAVPSLISGVGLSLFSSILVPSLTAIKADTEKLSASVTAATSLAAIGAIVTALIGVLATESILAVTTGLDGAKLRQVSEPARYIWIISALSIFGSYLTSLYHLRKEFLISAVTGIFPAIGMILGTVFLSSSIRIKGLVVGWLLATAIGCAILSPILFRCGFSLKKLNLRNPYALDCLRAVVPVAMGIVPFTILPTIDAYWASQLPEGSMAFIGYCTRIVIGVGSLVVSGVYVVILPHLTQHLANNEIYLFSLKMQAAIKAVIVLIIPAATVFLFFGRDIVTLLFQRGQFNERSTEEVAALLPFYLVGLVAMAPTTIVSRGYFALREYREFAALGVAMILFYFVVAGAFSARLSLHGIGIAYALYWIMFFSIGIVALRRYLDLSDLVGPSCKSLICSVVSSGLVAFLLGNEAGTNSWIVLPVKLSLVALVFVVLAWLLKLIEVNWLRQVAGELFPRLSKYR